MKLEHLAFATGVMRQGMTMRSFFEEAVRCNVPGLPYVDDQDRIIARISIRDVYKRIAVPDSLLRLADALGDSTDNLDLPEMKVMEMMQMPVEDFLLENMPTVSPRSPVVKALALMEVHNSSYVFLIEAGAYLGVVTRMVIAQRMVDCVAERCRNPD
jgi:CBS-domain-containing membrane protein